MSEHEELAELEVTAVECRSACCRVEVALDDSDRVHDLLPAFALQVAGSFSQMATKPVTEGEERVVIFLSGRDSQQPL